MRMRNRVALVGAVVVAGLGVGSLAIASSDDSEQPITGADLGRASAVAIEHLGGGTVTGTEVGDEDSYYEVEVTRDDGTQVDVQLDRSFAVVSDHADTEDGSEEGQQ